MTLIEYLTGAITSVFLFFVLSYYFLILIRPKKPHDVERGYSSISVIIPVHNEEKYVREALDSVINADFPGNKQIIVVDDGSIDRTPQILGGYTSNGALVIRTDHLGKSNAINTGLAVAKGELIAIVDGDSVIRKDALVEMARELQGKDVAAACGVIKVKNRKSIICMWVHIEQIYNSFIRSLLSKINANVTTPGPLSMYRADTLREVNGFSTQGFSEDQDITIRLIRKGYRIGFAQNAVSETNMPSDLKGFLRQRSRFARGLIFLLKRHLQLNNAIIDVYTLPLFLFTYIQALVMGAFITYQILTGYISYFVTRGVFFNWHVFKFFFEWFSIVGFVRWGAGIFTGTTPLNVINLLGIFSTLLSYPLFIAAIAKYDRRIDFWHIIPLLFMFPFWLLVMLIYIFCVPEYFRKKQYNIWKKNE